MEVPIPAGSVIITPAQMYDEIKATRAEVQQLSTLLNPAITKIQADVADHEHRLRSLERKVVAASGGAAVLGGGLTAVISQLLGG